MHLTKELFVIPHGKNFILYAPLKGAAAEVNRDIIALLKRVKDGEDIGGFEEKLSDLKKIGIVTEGETPVEKYVPDSFKPTSVTLVLGFDCTLRCSYCYSEGGEHIGKVLDLDIAKKAIDLIVENAISLGVKEVSLGFGGGGEPFMKKNMSLMKEIVEYFKKQANRYNLNKTISSPTNGIMDFETRKWIVAELDRVSISFDGPEDIQNNQRPFPTGRESFSEVMKTIRYFESVKFPYTLRATITQGSVSRMSEIVKFFSSISNSPLFHLEPLFECGRCKSSKIESPNPADYLRYLIEARELAVKMNRKIHFSGSVIEGIYDCFCNSVGNGAFCVLPDGNVTSCLEVCRENDPRAKVFMIGKYASEKAEFIFYKDRINQLASRNVDNLPNCKDCFAKYNCAGDCPVRCYSQSGSLFDTSNNSRCEINQGFIKYLLLQKLKEGKNETKF